MKTQFLSLAAIALISINALAATDNWKGSGAVYTPNGKLTETYQVEVVNMQLTPNVIQSTTTVTEADGHKKIISQKLTMNGNSWSDESNLGQGGGSCYGNDVCESYIVAGGGMAYATTVISDGPDARRDLTVILSNGKAIKVLRDKLTRLP